jgi:hypothetical protein
MRNIYHHYVWNKITNLRTPINVAQLTENFVSAVESQGLFPHSKQPPLIPVLRQLNPVHIFILHFFKNQTPKEINTFQLKVRDYRVNRLRNVT